MIYFVLSILFTALFVVSKDNDWPLLNQYVLSWLGPWFFYELYLGLENKKDEWLRCGLFIGMFYVMPTVTPLLVMMFLIDEIRKRVPRPILL